MNNTKCIICNAITNPFMIKDNYSLFKCSECALVFMNPLPEQKFLNNEVYSFESGYQSNKNSDLSKVVPSKKTIDIVNFLIKENRYKNILDIGCSSGEFIHYAKSKGFNVAGVELNKRTAQIAQNNGLRVFNGLLSDAKYQNGEFDVIFLGDVIEHVLSPSDLINECKRVLSSNGIIIVSTPNLDCLWSNITLLFYRYFKIPWSSVTPPYHTFQFSINNIDLFFNNLGFNKISEWFYKPPRLMYELGSLHLLKKYKKSKNILDLLFMIFSFALYSVTYYICYLLNIFLKKDFSHLVIYKKND